MIQTVIILTQAVHIRQVSVLFIAFAVEFEVFSVQINFIAFLFQQFNQKKVLIQSFKFDCPLEQLARVSKIVWLNEFLYSV